MATRPADRPCAAPSMPSASPADRRVQPSPAQVAAKARALSTPGIAAADDGQTALAQQFYLARTYSNSGGSAGKAAVADRRVTEGQHATAGAVVDRRAARRPAAAHGGAQRRSASCSGPTTCCTTPSTPPAKFPAELASSRRRIAPGPALGFEEPEPGVEFRSVRKTGLSAQGLVKLSPGRPTFTDRISAYDVRSKTLNTNSSPFDLFGSCSVVRSPSICLTRRSPCATAPARGRVPRCRVRRGSARRSGSGRRWRLSQICSTRPTSVRSVVRRA